VIASRPVAAAKQVAVPTPKTTGRKTNSVCSRRCVLVSSDGLL
jgi:hypothetical protein